MGQTLYQADEVEIALAEPYFIPNSQLNQLRREAIEQLDQARPPDNRLQRRAPIMPPPQYPQSHLTYLDNVYNRTAVSFITGMASP